MALVGHQGCSPHPAHPPTPGTFSRNTKAKLCELAPLQPLTQAPALCLALGVGSCSAFAHIPTFSHLFRPTFIIPHLILPWPRADVSLYPDSIACYTMLEKSHNLSEPQSSHP